MILPSVPVTQLFRFETRKRCLAEDLGKIRLIMIVNGSTEEVRPKVLQCRN